MEAVHKLNEFIVQSDSQFLKMIEFLKAINSESFCNITWVKNEETRN